MEKDFRICKDCKQIKERMQIGRYPKERNKKFIDAEGNTWVGSRCGPCHSIKMKNHMKEKRAKDKSGS